MSLKMKQKDEEKATRSTSSSTDEDLSKNSGRSSMIVFSAPLAKELSAQRLPPTYVGVRRVRPSSRLVAQVVAGITTATNAATSVDKNASSASTTTSAVVFKTIDAETGLERRMTTREKKEYRNRLKLEHKKRKREAREQQQQEKQQEVGATKKKAKTVQESVDTTTKEASSVEQEPKEDELVAAPKEEGETSKSEVKSPASDEVDQQKEDIVKSASNNTKKKQDRYVHLEIDEASLEEELADLRGDRDGVPPVIIAPALCQVALESQIVDNEAAPCSIGGNDVVAVVWDDALAQRWALQLKESMGSAEQVRTQEVNLRPMPYHLVPEVWSRLRPPAIGDKESSTPQTASYQNGNDASRPKYSRGDAWDFCQIRPVDDKEATATATVIQLLHRGTPLHISCGAKFGCDYLIYDGPRNERHAFAGIRILLTTSSNDDDDDDVDEKRHNLPLPTAYNLAGYVRCLNTAGKLALLATVVQETDSHGSVIKHRVAIVDLALEKTAETTSRRPTKTIEKRYQNLSKTTAST